MASMVVVIVGRIQSGGLIAGAGIETLLHDFSTRLSATSRGVQFSTSHTNPSIMTLRDLAPWNKREYSATGLDPDEDCLSCRLTGTHRP